MGQDLEAHATIIELLREGVEWVEIANSR